MTTSESSSNSNVERPHAARSTTPTTPATRTSDDPPPAVAQSFQQYDYVQQFSDQTVQDRVINALYHSCRSPRMWNSLLLLIGGPYDPTALGLMNTPIPRTSGPSALHTLPPDQQIKFLDAFAAFQTAEHADKLVSVIHWYSHSTGLSNASLKERYVNIACKVGAWRQLPDHEQYDFVALWKRLTYARLEGLWMLATHEGFRDPDFSEADREKVLWIFEYSHAPSYPALFHLLTPDADRFAAPCFRQMHGIARPIVSVDFTSDTPNTSNRLIDHLYEVAMGTIPPEFLYYIDQYTAQYSLADPSSRVQCEAGRRLILGTLVLESGEPDGNITQRDAGSCPYTSLLNRLANIRPAEYVRMAKSLILTGSVTFDWNANNATRYYRDQFLHCPEAQLLDATDLMRTGCDEYRSGPTRIDLARARDRDAHHGRIMGWNRSSCRFVPGRVLQESLARFIEARRRGADPNEQGAFTIDVMLMAVGMLGARTGFRIFREGYQICHAANPPLERLRRITVNPDWITELQGVLKSRQQVVFASFLWGPEHPRGRHVTIGQCCDANFDREREHYADGHCVQVRAVRPQTDAAGNAIVGSDGRPRMAVDFWNPWGAEQLDSNAATTRESNPSAVGPDGSVEQHDPVEYSDHQPVDAAYAGELPEGPVTHIIQDNNSHSGGMMWMDADEFVRNVGEFGYLDQAPGRPPLSRGGDPDPPSTP